jgi:hypothetical protein
MCSVQIVANGYGYIAVRLAVSSGCQAAREGQAGSRGETAACVSELGQTAYAILSEPKIVILNEKRRFSRIFSAAI